MTWCAMFPLYQVCVLVFILLLECSSVESRVTFTASPSFISPGLTPTLKIRCSVEEDAAYRVASIIVLRTNPDTGVNETIATVTAFDAAIVKDDLGNLEVSGSTNSSLLGEKGYLQLNWTNPAAQQSGTYICDVFTVNSVGSGQLVEDLRVGISLTTTQELLLYIADLERRTEKIEKLLTQLRGGNVQTGYVVCIQGTYDYPISFSAPYSSVPTVVTAVAGTRNAGGFINTPTILSLTRAGFTLHCTSHDTTDVVWVAI